MVNFLPNIISVVKEDASLANNVMLKAVIENVQLKASSFQSEYDMQENIKLQLEGVNAYLNNSKITEVIEKISEELTRERKDNVHLTVAKMYNEIDLGPIVKSIVESEAYKETSVFSYIAELERSLNESNTPQFKYIPGFIQAMQPVMHHDSVRESVNTVQTYLTKNYPRLILMEAIHYLDTTANGFYRNIATKLKSSLIAEQYNPKVLEMELGGMSSMTVVSNMINALKSVQENKDVASGFSIGKGNASVKIYNYIGPVLKEDNSLTAFVGNTFMHITPEVLDPINYTRIVEKVEGLTVAEYKAKYVFENKREFHDLALSYSTLGFRNVKDSVSSKLRNLKIDLKINESMELDLYINDKKISDPKQVNMANLFIMENALHKNCALNVFSKIDHIYNVEFMKFIVNESTGKTAMIMNVKDNFIVYDINETGGSTVHKMDKFKLVKYVAETFNYDISDFYKIEYNEAVTKIKLLEHKKGQVIASIQELEKSINSINESLGKDLNEKDRADLTSLKEEVENEIIKLKNAYIILENEEMEVKESQPEASVEELKMNDDVELADNGQQGKIVAINGDKYTVFTTDNKFVPATRDQITLKKEEGQTTNEPIVESMEAETTEPGDESVATTKEDSDATASESTAAAEESGAENTEAAKTENEAGPTA